MEWEKRGVGNISFRWWRKPECRERTTGQPQVTDNLLTCVYPVSYTHLRAHETSLHLVCRLLLEKKKSRNGALRIEIKCKGATAQ